MRIILTTADCKNNLITSKFYYLRVKTRGAEKVMFEKEDGAL
jgi:hypothetical protein